MQNHENIPEGEQNLGLMIKHGLTCAYNGTPMHLLSLSQDIVDMAIDDRTKCSYGFKVGSYNNHLKIEFVFIIQHNPFTERLSAQI